VEQYAAPVPQYPYCEQQFPAEQETPYGAPQAPAGADGVGDVEIELVFVIVFVVRVEQLEELEEVERFDVVLDNGFEEVIVACLMKLVDVESFDIVLVVAFVLDLVEMLGCEEVDFGEDLEMLVVEWLLDEVFVDSVVAFVVLLTEEEVVGIGHKRGCLESYPVRMLFTADW